MSTRRNKYQIAPEPAPPPPPPPPPQPTEAEIKAHREAQAAALRNNLTAAHLVQIIGPQNADRAVMNLYVQTFLCDAKDPVDPVERLMLEQMLLAHVRLGKLQVQADAASSVESQKVICTLAVRLMSEIRKMALALRQLRLPVATKQFSVVHQQNIATGAKQDVTFVDQSRGSEEKVSFSSRTGLEDNAPPNPAQREDHNGTDDNIQRPQVAGKDSRGAAQRPEAAPLEC